MIRPNMADLSIPTHARLVSHDPSQRSPVHPNTWNYIKFASWENEVWKLLRPLVTKAVRDEFLANPPEYVVGDDLSWLNDIIAKVRGREVDSKAYLGELLSSRYTAIRAVHGTRTDDVDRFYRDGLVPLDPATVHNDARNIFLGGEFTELTEEKLAHAIKEVGSDLREGRVFFEANEEMLVDRCGHYMLYGSEYLTAIAAHLKGHRDYRQVLKRRGSPTLFVCDVPMRLISWHTLLDFSGTAIQLVFDKLLQGPEFKPEFCGAGFSISQGLPPTAIIGHCHPVVRRDAFLGTW